MTKFLFSTRTNDSSIVSWPGGFFLFHPYHWRWTCWIGGLLTCCRHTIAGKWVQSLFVKEENGRPVSKQVPLVAALKAMTIDKLAVKDIVVAICTSRCSKLNCIHDPAAVLVMAVDVDAVLLVVCVMAVVVVVVAAVSIVIDPLVLDVVCGCGDGGRSGR